MHVLILLFHLHSIFIILPFSFWTF